VRCVRVRAVIVLSALVCAVLLWLPSQTSAATFTPDQSEEFVERLYSVVLQRTADSPGLSSNVNLALALGDDFVRTLTQGFLLSPEFTAGFGSDPTSFVTTLYLSILNRIPASSEVNFWAGALGTNRAGTISSFLSSTEYLTVVSPTLNTDAYLESRPLTLNAAEQAAFVARLYNVLLQRDPDPEGFQFHLQRLQAGGRDYLDDLITVFMTSPEFVALTSSSPQDPNMVVAALYLVLLNRAADAEGLNNFVTQLQAGTTSITQLVADFMNSPEGQQVLADVNNVGYLMSRPADQARGFQQIYTSVSTLLSLAPGILTVEEQQTLQQLEQAALAAGVSGVVSPSSP